MAVYCTAFGAMFIPLGILLRIDAPQLDSWMSLFLIILGFIAMVFGFIETRFEEKQRQKENYARALLLSGIADKMGVDVKGIMGEVLKEYDHRDSKNRNNQM